MSSASSAASPAGFAGAAPRTILRPGEVITQSHWPAHGPVTSLHVIRIGGAGMSAVARLALEAGLAVSGSDSQDGQFIGPLREAGARIGIGFDGALLAADVDVVVVSTAVRGDNPEVIEAHRRGIPVVHRAAALAGLLAGRDLLAVAGTHGKTSTTAMAVMALRGAGLDPAWALGAAVPDLGRNAGFSAAPFPQNPGPERPAAESPAPENPAPEDPAPRAPAGSGDLALVEADESDGSFLAFAPRALVVTNLEPDHLDFHGDAATLTAAFDALVGQLRPGGALVVCADDDGARDLGERAAATGIEVIAYGTSSRAQWRVVAERSRASGAAVELDTPRGPIRLELGVAGHHNVLNALGALAGAAAAAPDLDPALLAAGLGTFTGASRRFEVAGTAGGVTVVDDYAHHPREVAATIHAARGIVEGQQQGGRVLVVFQPHLFSRTRAFALDFAHALSGADQAWVLPVYAAREDPDPAVDATTITDHVTSTVAAALTETVTLPSLVSAAAHPGDLLLMLGAGDVVETTPRVMAALGEPGEGA